MTARIPAYCALILTILCGAQNVKAQPGENWSEHRNQKYGFSLKYPSETFTIERTTEAGDGLAFVSKDGQARLLVGALINKSVFTPPSYQAYLARESYGMFKITYRPQQKTWFVLSGEGDGKTFYEKVIFSCSGKLINSFAMIYPTNQSGLYDPIVESIEDTFRGGSACAGAGAAPATTRRLGRKTLL